MYCLPNLSFFDIPLLYYYTNLNSSIILCIFFGDICPFFGTSISSSFCECDFLGDFLETLVILSAILLPIKSSVASAVFIASAVHFLALLTYCLHFCPCS